MKFRKLGTLPEFKSKETIMIDDGFHNHYERSKLIGSQAATPIVLEDRIRIYFSARDIYNQSHAIYYDVRIDNLLEVIDRCEESVISLGSPGEADEHGVMPSHCRESFLYYTGWNKTERQDVRFRTCSMSFTLKTKEKEVIFDRTTTGKCGTSMPYNLDGGWGVYWLLMDITKWENGEPYYNIVEYSKSKEGFPSKVILDLKGGEGGIARPVSIEIDKTECLFYCKRMNRDYRKNKDSSYKMYVLKNWGYNLYPSKDPSLFSKEELIEIEGEEDPLMIAYGYPLAVKDKIYMFYNTSFTGPISVSELVEV